MTEAAAVAALAGRRAEEDGSDPNQPLIPHTNSRSNQRTLARQRSHFAVPKEESYESINGAVPANIKNEFIKKVYGILTVEILYTALVASVFTLYEPLREGSLHFVKAHGIMFQVLLFGGLIGSLCGLMVNKNEYPANFRWTFIFVTIMSINIGVVCAFYYAAGHGLAIVQALGVTCVIFLTLSIYAHWTKTDFSYMGGFLICALWGNILFGLIAYWTGSTWAQFGYHVIGVLIFCGFILYDTSEIINKYGCDDYIIGSIELYLDFVNLFLHILALLGDN